MSAPDHQSEEGCNYKPQGDRYIQHERGKIKKSDNTMIGWKQIYHTLMATI